MRPDPPLRVFASLLTVGELSAENAALRAQVNALSARVEDHGKFIRAVLGMFDEIATACAKGGRHVSNNHELGDLLRDLCNTAADLRELRLTTGMSAEDYADAFAQMTPKDPTR